MSEVLQRYEVKFSSTRVHLSVEVLVRRKLGEQYSTNVGLHGNKTVPYSVKQWQEEKFGKLVNEQLGRDENMQEDYPTMERWRKRKTKRLPYMYICCIYMYSKYRIVFLSFFSAIIP